MRTLASRCVGSTQSRTLTAVVVLAIVIGVVAILLRRPAPTPVQEGKSSGSPVELSRTNLVLENGRLQLPGASNAFTGLMVEHYPTGTLRSRSSISNGLLHGLSQGWYTNGQMQVSENFKEGVSHGLRTKWYASGAKQSEANIVDGKLQGTFRRWYENGVLSEQAEFVADQAEGPSVAYYASGFLKARVTLRGGKPTEQMFWKDGEKKE